jgi:ribonucleoside-diphosphate reductase alpha chain
MSLFVVKRNGEQEKIHFDKILKRITTLAEISNVDEKYVDVSYVAQKTIQGIYAGIPTSRLDELSSEICASLTTRHPDYAKLGAAILVSNLHKETSKSIVDVTNHMEFADVETEDEDVDETEKVSPYIETNERGVKQRRLMSKEYVEVVRRYGPQIQAALDFSRDYSYSYFGLKTLMATYLRRANGKIVERPQHMIMRVAIALHCTGLADKSEAAMERALERAFLTYEDMSLLKYTHATPTLYNAGLVTQQLSSCFLVTMKEDSIEGIYDTLKECAMIARHSGGIGLNVTNLRAEGTIISSSGRPGMGLVPIIRLINNQSRAVTQAHRSGSIAIYLEPWHADINVFLSLKNQTGKDEHRARDLFYALWVPDLFMKRASAGENWSLFCPKRCSKLYKVYGEEFEELYVKYEKKGLAVKVINAARLMEEITRSQIENGMPYILFKDSINKKNNQANLGTIRCSNLCAEVVQYSSRDETAVCNLGSLSLPYFVTRDGRVDYNLLYKTTRSLAYNLDRVIDINFYPVETARRSNMRHRPIGLGVQGLANMFAELNIPYDSDEARDINRKIFETIYFACITQSCALAREVYEGLVAKSESGLVPAYAGAYESFVGSPAHSGRLQPDMWGVELTNDLWDWTSLRSEIAKYGLRNSLSVALMPTASTAQILGNSESFEPFSSNIYLRRVLSGEFQVVNSQLVRDLSKLNMWNEAMRVKIISNDGSIQSITEIPEHIRNVYRTVWEVPTRNYIDMCADRAAFICQTQSMNVYMTGPSSAKLASMLKYAWTKGLKTGLYYLRTSAASSAIKFSIENNTTSEKQENETPPASDEEDARLLCSITNPGACDMCSG